MTTNSHQRVLDDYVFSWHYLEAALLLMLVR
jgi:hypothetical protein